MVNEVKREQEVDSVEGAAGAEPCPPWCSHWFAWTELPSAPWGQHCFATAGETEAQA